jgi:hypothetical protein
VIAGSFEIVVSDYTSSVEEYRRAQQAPRSDLPPLSDDQRAAARGFKISEEEYRRGVLAGIYGRKRQQARGRRLGEEVRKILSDLGSDDRVVRVAYEMDRLRWVVSIEASGRILDVAVPRELADDVLDRALREQTEELRARVARGLGRTVAVAKP